MIDVKTVLYILAGFLTVGGAVVAFFQMQTRQNMKIESLEKEFEELKKKLSDQSKYQIQTEKAIVEINTKLDSIMEAIKELKGNNK